ncbi:LysE family translocator [Acinetobacter pittii]|uniref:LysE family translocator n=1 Tax=Acinetobacter pittii TaxID=48296 RepID=UPI000D3402B4|nr:LysE family translocator [Acinetobacter pittii]PTV46206.1 LysE family translocator [Acinetobacter pittii]
MNYNFLTFIITVLIINLSPGPAMIYVMNQSSKYGIKAGLKAAAGVEFGVFFYVLLTAFGLMVIFQETPMLYRIIQFMGALYLIYLAYLSWPKRKSIQSPNILSQNSSESVRHTFSKGMLINLSNPKIGLFFVSLLPQFVPSDSHPAWLHFLLYGLIFNFGGICVNVTVGAMARKLKTIIQRASWFDYVPPLLFLSIAVLSIAQAGL